MIVNDEQYFSKRINKVIASSLHRHRVLSVVSLIIRPYNNNLL